MTSISVKVYQEAAEATNGDITKQIKTERDPKFIAKHH